MADLVTVPGIPFPIPYDVAVEQGLIPRDASADIFGGGAGPGPGPDLGWAPPDWREQHGRLPGPAPEAAALPGIAPDAGVATTPDEASAMLTPARVQLPPELEAQLGPAAPPSDMVPQRRVLEPAPLVTEAGIPGIPGPAPSPTTAADLIKQGADEQARAIRERGDVEAAGIAKRGALLQEAGRREADQYINELDINGKAAAKLQDQMGVYAEEKKKLADRAEQPFDPWENKSWGQQAAALISAAIVGYLNPGKPNWVVEMLERMVDRDMAKRNKDFDRQMEALTAGSATASEAYDNIGKSLLVKNLAFERYMNGMIVQAEAEGLNAQSEAAKIKANEVVGALKESVGKNLQNMQFDLHKLAIESAKEETNAIQTAGEYDIKRRQLAQQGYQFGVSQREKQVERRAAGAKAGKEEAEQATVNGLRVYYKQTPEEVKAGAPRVEAVHPDKEVARDIQKQQASANAFMSQAKSLAKLIGQHYFFTAKGNALREYAGSQADELAAEIKRSLEGARGSDADQKLYKNIVGVGPTWLLNPQTAKGNVAKLNGMAARLVSDVQSRTKNATSKEDQARVETWQPEPDSTLFDAVISELVPEAKVPEVTIPTGKSYPKAPSRSEIRDEVLRNWPKAPTAFQNTPAYILGLPEFGAEVDRRMGENRLQEEKLYKAQATTPTAVNDLRDEVTAKGNEIKRMLEHEKADTFEGGPGAYWQYVDSLRADKERLEKQLKEMEAGKAK